MKQPKQQQVIMKPKVVDFTEAHFAFFARFKKQGGNPCQLIRIALDKEIQKYDTEQQKITNYQK